MTQYYLGKKYYVGQDLVYVCEDEFKYEGHFTRNQIYTVRDIRPIRGKQPRNAIWMYTDTDDGEEYWTSFDNIHQHFKPLEEFPEEVQFYARLTGSIPVDIE